MSSGHTFLRSRLCSHMTEQTELCACLPALLVLPRAESSPLIAAANSLGALVPPLANFGRCGLRAGLFSSSKAPELS